MRVSRDVDGHDARLSGHAALRMMQQPDLRAGSPDDLGRTRGAAAVEAAAARNSCYYRGTNSNHRLQPEGSQLLEALSCN